MNGGIESKRFGKCHSCGKKIIPGDWLAQDMTTQKFVHIDCKRNDTPRKRRRKLPNKINRGQDQS